LPDKSVSKGDESGDDTVVTGSRIRSSNEDSISPVTIIKGKDLDRKGYRSVFDALTQLPQNSGAVQGENSGATFTPAANVINLRGMGPNHALVLIDGHRMADYPDAYDGSINAVNLANLPSGVVQQIDVLTGGAGAIYGSDAIAGVVNIQLRKHVHGLESTVRYGFTEEGGGASIRTQLAGGHDFGRLSLVGAVEYTHRAPLFWGDRSLTRDFSRFPSDTPAPDMFSLRDPTGDRPYYDPPAGACERNAALQGGTIARVAAATGGSYCGSNGIYSGGTMQTQKDLASGYLHATFDAGNDVELFGTLLYSAARIQNLIRQPTWGRTFFNSATDRLETWRRVLTSEEMGDRFGSGTLYHENSWNGTIGLRGRLPGDWRYEASYDRSEYASTQRRRRWLTAVDDFFLGPQQGTAEVLDAALPVYAPDPSRLWAPLTPTQYRSISRRFRDRSTSNLQDLAFTANGNLFALPGGPAQAAFVIEGGSQSFSSSEDPLYATGIAWRFPSGPDSYGRRGREAAGGELRLPWLKQVTTVLAGRYDRYTYRGRTVGQGTYTAGLQVRPVQALLLRGSYTTSFRAPDMNYVFASEVGGYSPNATDYYQCRLAQQDYSSCTITYDMDSPYAGNPDLKPERGRSWTAGAVLTPNRHLRFSVDYYDIALKDEVTTLSADSILRTEADCRLGASLSGSAVDPASALCRDYVGRVARNAADAAIQANVVQSVRVSPINAARERSRGIDIQGDGEWTIEGYGTISAAVAYSKTLAHTAQQFAGDAEFDQVHDLAYQSDWRDRANASLSWKDGPFEETISGIRYGVIPRADFKATYPAYTLINASISCDLTDKLNLSLIGNNIADRYPVDPSAGWPGHNAGWYHVVGRQIWVQLSAKL
jgi:outer membrane receptor protein involved in Fe transport